MKLYQDYKKLYRTNKSHRKDLCFYIGLSCAIGFLLIIPIAFSFADTKEELNQKISQKNDDIDKLEKEIKIYQNELNSIGKQKSSLAGSLKELDITSKKLKADIAVTQKKDR